ncbi:hypothetical protein [Brevundimonas sp. DC300-4]|uniref:hypothetical protein n=1 Tax=Brevundimonas sp. DC300-4 TaxID=2804594 RepID=UPI003CEFB0DF
MSSAISDFERDCDGAGVTPASVLRRAGLNPSNWPRWRSGESSPTLRSFDAARAALEGLKRDFGSVHGGQSPEGPPLMAPAPDHGAEKSDANISRTEVVV